MLSWAVSWFDSENACWTCGLFDRLFVIISNSAAVIYDKLAIFGTIIFFILFGFYIFSAFWKNMEKGFGDPFLQKSVKPVLIKSLLVLSLLTLGLTVPKFISKITFEPVATVTLEYAKAILPQNTPLDSDYQKIELSEDGFFSSKLRDTLLQLIQSNLVGFQTYIKFGINVMDKAFSLSNLREVVPLLPVAAVAPSVAITFGAIALFRHAIIFLIGLFLTYNFFRLFVKYSFCFLDIIVAMAMFAFFFPLSLVLFVFKDASDLPAWMKSLGGNLGSGQIKKLINAIVSVASTILTYTIIMMIIRGYLDSTGFDPNSGPIDYESLFNFDPENSDVMQLTFFGAIVLVYVIRYIADQVPQITNKIMSAFGVSQEDSLSKEMGDNILQLSKIVKDKTKEIAKTVISSGQNSSGQGATDATAPTTGTTK